MAKKEKLEIEEDDGLTKWDRAVGLTIPDNLDEDRVYLLKIPAYLKQKLMSCADGTEIGEMVKFGKAGDPKGATARTELHLNSDMKKLHKDVEGSFIAAEKDVKARNGRKVPARISEASVGGRLGRRPMGAVGGPRRAAAPLSVTAGQKPEPKRLPAALSRALPSALSRAAPSSSGVKRPPMGGVKRPPMGGVKRPPMGGVKRPPMGGVMRPPMGGRSTALPGDQRGNGGVLGGRPRESSLTLNLGRLTYPCSSTAVEYPSTFEVKLTGGGAKAIDTSTGKVSPAPQPASGGVSVNGRRSFGRPARHNQEGKVPKLPGDMYLMEMNANGDTSFCGVVSAKYVLRVVEDQNAANFRQYSALADSMNSSSQPEFSKGVRKSSSLGASRRSVEEKKQEKQRKENNRRTRIPENELRQELLEMFSESRYLLYKDINDIVRQPDEHLKKVLRSIAELHRDGDYHNQWELKREFQ